MKLFRRTPPSWPKELERRESQNTERRYQFEKDHRALLAKQAKQAAKQVIGISTEIDRLDDIARWIELGGS